MDGSLVLGSHLTIAGQRCVTPVVEREVAWRAGRADAEPVADRAVQTNSHIGHTASTSKGRAARNGEHAQPSQPPSAGPETLSGNRANTEAARVVPPSRV